MGCHLAFNGANALCVGLMVGLLVDFFGLKLRVGDKEFELKEIQYDDIICKQGKLRQGHLNGKQTHNTTRFQTVASEQKNSAK